ncbi:hypothetical protein JN01_0599 [Entomoplasma freundtii]|uniref:Uncharacterized protein n=1 Tax=Entomoplasma freundtii TaxID=74700 RepID=A0A2K8NR89_9MOLU|nr:hypothetical protein [Entomoplasma freundtii]ATZ16360.1 hypothetical protein EFREU_v1c03340 [Entomoplasma freundtii]TDY56601.1 hypothetical protein JN01_0599 [Entomoplasma freundtii]
MEPNKVYKSLVYLAYNVVKHERLRYELDNKAIFRDQFVKQINNMLALEKDFNQTFNNQTWTTVFAQAIVKVTQQKQRFEKRDGLSVEEIYADYSSFLSYTSTTFEVGRNTLTEEIVNFSPDEVLIDATLTDQTKNHYRELEKERLEREKQAQETKDKPKPEFSSSQNQERTYSQQNNNSFFGGGGYANVNTMDPRQNPRFYPYMSKPKWMPTLKYVFAGLVILATLMLIATSIAMMTVKMNLGPNNTSNPFGNALFGEAMWASHKGNWDSFLTKSLRDSNAKFPLNWSLMSANVGSILSLVFYSLPAIYIGYAVFRKPRSLKEKYRLSMMSVIFMFIMFFVAGSNIFNVMSAHQISKNFEETFKRIFDNEFVGDNSNYNFKAFWAVMMEKHGAGIEATSIIADIAVALIAVSVVLGIVMLVLNPRLDRQKMMHAMTEYQRANIAMMQGQSYQVDPSLFDDDTQTIKAKKETKFGTWWKKTFTKKDKPKSPQDNQTQN